MPGQASVSTIVIPTKLIIFRSPHKLLKTSTNRAVNWTSRNFIVPRQGPAHTIALQWTAFMIALCYDLYRQFHVYNVSVSRFLVGTFSRHYEICEVSLTALSTSPGSSHQDWHYHQWQCSPHLLSHTLGCELKISEIKGKQMKNYKLHPALVKMIIKNRI